MMKGERRKMVSRMREWRKARQAARALCERWNAMHKPGRLSRKAEYEQE